jgi:hypothetical protein
MALIRIASRARQILQRIVHSSPDAKSDEPKSCYGYMVANVQLKWRSAPG